MTHVAPLAGTSSGDVQHPANVGRPLLENGTANKALTRTRVMVALWGVLLHMYLNLVWDTNAWLAGLSALQLLVASMVVADTGETFAPLAIAFDMAVAVALGVLIGDPRAAAPWLVALTPLLLAVVAPRVGLLLLALLPVGYALAWALVGGLDRPLILTDDQLTTYLVAAMAAVAASIGVLVIEVGWAMRRRAAEEETRVRELEVLTENSPIGMAIQDIHRRFVYTNPRLRDMLGLTVSQIEQNGLTGAIPAEVLARIEPIIVEAQLKRESVDFEHAIKRPDGTVGWVAVSMSEPLLQADGKPLFVFSIVDVSEKIVATTRSRRFAQALDGTSDIVLLWDTLRRPLHMNAAFLRFFGTSEKHRSRAVEHVFSRLDAHLPQWSSMPGGSTADFDAEFLRRDSAEPVPFSIVVTVAQDEHQATRSFALLARDISAPRRVSEELREVVRSKEQFMASVSHELRTPISVVLGLASELAEGVGQFAPGELAELAHLIAEQSTDVAGLVDDLVMAAGADTDALTVAPVETEVGPVVSEVVRSMRNELRVTVAPEVHKARVFADLNRLKQVVRNLVTNAFQHGGTEVRIEARECDGGLALVVADNGPPISAAVQSTMFEAYGRGHPSAAAADSVGLGLTVSRDLVRRMDGDVVYSHEDGWSQFAVVLPTGSPTGAD